MKWKDIIVRDAGMNFGFDIDQLRKFERFFNLFVFQLVYLLSGDSNSICFSVCFDVYVCVYARSCLCVCIYVYIDVWYIVMV